MKHKGYLNKSIHSAPKIAWNGEATCRSRCVAPAASEYGMVSHCYL